MKTTDVPTGVRTSQVLLTRRAVMLLGVGLLAAATLLVGPADAEDAPAATKTDGTVTFYTGSSTSTKPFTTSLTVKKEGMDPELPELVNGPPAAGENAIDGRHNFPKHTSRKDVGAYYRGLLENAGYEDPRDFTIGEGGINFYDICKLDGGSTVKNCPVDGVTDNEEVCKFEEVDPDKPRKCSVGLERNSIRMPGCVTFTAFGIHWNGDDTITTTTSVATVHFTADDTAAAVIGRACDELEALGWGVEISSTGRLELSENGEGDRIHSLSTQVRYYEEEGGSTENEDHWVFYENED